ncbi:MAG: ion transporter [Planctomycetota bacterium]
MSAESPAPTTPTDPLGPGPAAWQQAWHRVIFGHQTAAGRAFDFALLVVIIISVAAVMLESVPSLDKHYHSVFQAVEWGITILFSIEFLARMACVAKPPRYAGSFFGVVDLVSLLPTYLSLAYPGADSLATIRTLRLLRVFRLLKLARHVREAQGLLVALRRTWPRITVFLSVIVCTIVILGTVMYLVEANAGSGFDDIPTSVYWAIVTMTTVGYGDIAPCTPLGKTIAALIMLFGYAIIIVPTGLFAAQVVAEKVSEGQPATRGCASCGAAGISVTANYCPACGDALNV